MHSGCGKLTKIAIRRIQYIHVLVNIPPIPRLIGIALECFCNSCNADKNGTCIVGPQGKCYTAVEKTDEGDVWSFGCYIDEEHAQFSVSCPFLSLMFDVKFNEYFACSARLTRCHTRNQCRSSAATTETTATSSSTCLTPSTQPHATPVRLPPTSHLFLSSNGVVKIRKIFF